MHGRRLTGLEHARSTLDSVTKVYDGTKSLSYPRLLASLDRGIDPDQMKGALYVSPLPMSFRPASPV